MAHFCLSGCRPASIVEVDATEINRTITIPSGDKVALTLQTVGPGGFAAPPEVSSTSVRFLSMEYINTLPAGPTQRFTFVALSRGTSVVVFRHTASSRVVQDTVVVK